VTTASLPEIIEFLDRLLRTREIPDADAALNGLQVENHGAVAWIIAAVDASFATIASAAQRRPGSPGLLVVHHGLFWDGNQPLTGRRYRRIRALLENDMALYSAHIPLDLHPEVGNNALLAQRLGLAIEGGFGPYRGSLIGVYGRAPASVGSREHLVQALSEALQIDSRTITLIPGGPSTPSRVGVITGAAGDMVAAARAAGVDTFITGEGPHHSYFDAVEWGINLVYAGHYASETLGVQALAARAAATFGLPWEFCDHPTGL
jgi:dinuclear metal center YbgI/SA1388 family protein